MSQIGKQRLDVPSKEWFIEFYSTQKHTPKELVEILNRLPTTTKEWKDYDVKNCLTRYGIPRHGERSQKSALIKASPLSKNEREIIIGSVLGDGSISHSNGHFGVFSEAHTTKQVPYLLWKYEQLKRLCTSPPASFTSTYTKKDGTLAEGMDFRTIAHPDIKELSAHMYKDNHKDHDVYVRLRMSLLVLTVWYLDDGALHPTRQGKYAAVISTEGIPQSTLELTKNFLNKKYSMELTLTKTNRGFGYSIYIPTKSPFFELIAPFVPESMQYKLPPYLRSLPETEGNETG